MSRNQGKQSQFPPKWLQVIVNILIAVVLIGSYLYVYVSANIVAYRKTVLPKWLTTMDPIVEMILGGVGGVVAAVFAVALNLPKSALPRTFKEVAARVMEVLTVFAPSPRRPEEKGIDWEKVNQRALLVCGIVLTISFPVLTIASVVSKLGFKTYAPDFISNFAGAGAGVLAGAFAVWISGILGEP